MGIVASTWVVNLEKYNHIHFYRGVVDFVEIAKGHSGDPRLPHTYTFVYLAWIIDWVPYIEPRSRFCWDRVLDETYIADSGASASRARLCMYYMALKIDRL